MATFSITVQGTVTKPLLSSPTENHSSCESTFDMKVFGLTGHEIELTWSVISPGGYINYTVTLDTGGGFAGISSGHTFTPNGTAFLHVVMENSGVEETIQIDMTATNNTVADSQVRALIRNGLAGIC